MKESLIALRALKKQHEKRWLALEGVCGVGIGSINGSPGIIVTIERLTPAIQSEIPAFIEQFPIEIRTTGPITAQPDLF